MNKKKCSKCNELLPETDEYFHKDKGGLHGLKATCKECIKKILKSQQKPIIYKITHIESDKVYIGQTIKPINKRISHHFSTAKIKPVSLLHLEIEKENFQKDKFIYEILQECSNKEELDNAERFWIAKYKQDGYVLYNLENGGRIGYQVNPISKEKISKGHKGKKITQEHLNKIKETKIKNGTYGIVPKLSEESKRKISESRRGHKDSVGSKNSMAVLNEDIVLKIIKMLIDGHYPKKISDELKVSAKLISEINRRKTWRHVTVDGYEDVEVYHIFRNKKNNN